MINNADATRWADLFEGMPTWDIGGKAKGLSSLISCGAPVPPTWVLAPAYVEVLSLADDSALLVQRSLETLWRRIRNEQVKSLAVRSSASIEDGFNDSHAGQFKTVLDVATFPELRRAVKTVYRSLEKCVAGNMAVILQPFVKSLLSGVLFNTDPVTGDHLHYVIEFSGAHASAVVDGTDARRLLFNRITRKFAGENNDLSCLPIFEALIATVERFEGQYPFPIDVEWCWASEREDFLPDQLCILQCRPALVRTRALPAFKTQENVVERITHFVSGRRDQ